MTHNDFVEIAKKIANYFSNLSKNPIDKTSFFGYNKNVNRKQRRFGEAILPHRGVFFLFPIKTKEQI